MITIKNLTKRYGELTAVQDISLAVAAGEIVGFLGINGAGKTTTLKILAGILQSTSGEIVLGGYNLATDAEAAKAITGYIPDRPYLYNKLTAREFLYFVADLYQVKTRTQDDRIDELLREYSLLQWQNELIESFSHGMKQRLATCAALVHQPKILIVDEPMVGLDPHGARFLKQAFRRYADAGMAILLSTHSLNVAEEMADRVAIIHHGVIITQGTVGHVKAQGTNSSHRDHRLEDVFIELTAAEECDAGMAYGMGGLPRGDATLFNGGSVNGGKSELRSPLPGAAATLEPGDRGKS